jgi:hypothetical protein
MKPISSNPNLPVRDYSNALRCAVDWLGDRYLLAVPVAPRRGTRRTPALILQPEPWLWLDKPRA